jgi:hypothetical protein
VRAVWSLWTKPLRRWRGSGWPDERYHMLSWILSLQTSRRFFDPVCLVTDQAGKRMLVDDLGLRFDEVSTELDVLDDHDPSIWALGKLYAYRAQTEPFMHIDNDVYWWKPPPPALLDAPVFAVYPEHTRYGTWPYLIGSLRTIVAAADGWLPAELDAFVPVGGIARAENCGIVGGQRVDFIQHYADQAIKLIEHPRNQPAWAVRRTLHDDMVIFEQHMLSACLDYYQSRPGLGFDGVAIRYLFNDFWDAQARADDVGFTHLLSYTKRLDANVVRVEARVARDYPELYARCIERFAAV